MSGGLECSVREVVRGEVELLEREHRAVDHATVKLVETACSAANRRTGRSEGHAARYEQAKLRGKRNVAAARELGCEERRRQRSSVHAWTRYSERESSGSLPRRRTWQPHPPCNAATLRKLAQGV